ncbi:MAG: MBL fold metallo-hydrolase [Acidobacteriota bacterium]
MPRAITALIIALLTPIFSVAQTPAAKTLDIYVVDVEGGTAILFVSPTGESMLVDSGGNARAVVAPRDAGRIMEAVKAAGLQKIDHMITSHYDYDHYAGLADLASRIQIDEYIDHGPNAQPNEQADTFLKDVYPQLYAKAKHKVVKPGDRIPLAGADVLVVTSAGEIIKTPLPGGGKPNPECANIQTARSNMEDPQSISLYITYGKFRLYHSSDLPRGKETELMCPNATVGPVDLLLGLHHGTNQSNSPVLVHAVRPRVAILNNGTRKGGNPDVMETVFSSPGLEDLWQMHFSTLSGQEYTVPGRFIANLIDDQPSSMPIAPAPPPAPGAGAPPPPAHEGKAYWFKVSVRQDGTFTVTNTRNGFSKTY